MVKAMWAGTVLTLGITIAAVVVLTLTRQSSATLTRDPYVEESRIAAMEQRIELLQRQLLAQQMVSQQQAKPFQAAPQATASSIQPVNAEKVEPLTVEQQQISYEQRFNSTAGNTSWSNLKEGELRHVTTATSLAKVRSVECQGTMCRVETEHSSQEEAEEFLYESEQTPALLGTTYHRYPLDGSGTRFVMFIEPAEARTSKAK